MQASDHDFLVAQYLATMAERPRETPSEWAVKHYVFDEPNNRGPFRTEGREYLIDVLNDFARVDVSDEANVWGSQTGKTGILMAGVAWAAVNDPCCVFWVMPTVDLARRFSRTRFIKSLRATPPTASLIPRGALRHNFATLEQHLGGAVVLFVGSNSPATLSSTPARRVIQDEVDKFNEGTAKETDASDLADQRTKDQVSPQRWKTSTPTIVEGPIWQAFLKGDQRRYFVPCPFCAGKVVLAWSPAYSVFKRTGAEAWVHWDPAAKRSGGSWDYDMVARSVHFACPHCKGRIGNEHKTAMVRGGEWRPTHSFGRSGFVSRQLPSLYATSAETTLAKLAVKFLEAKASLLGVQGFINGDLAEPYQAQDTLGNRVEIITPEPKADAAPTPEQAPTRLMTVDCQARAPYFWWVVREWREGECEGIAVGSADSWEEVEDVQKAHGVEDLYVGVDSGWGARSDSDVYAKCYDHSILRPRVDQCHRCIGWIPMKGAPGRKLWRHQDGIMRPWYFVEVDPFEGKAQSGRVGMKLLHFSGDHLKDALHGLRQKQGPYRWMVRASMATEEYWKHLDAEVKTPVRNMRNGRVTHQWMPRSKHWPNHLNDCEVNQIALAVSLSLFNLPTPKPDDSGKAASHA